MLIGRRIGLERHVHDSEVNVRKLHGRVASAGEAEHGPEIARLDRMPRIMVPFGRRSLHVRPDIPERARLETIEQAQARAATCRIGHKFPGPVADRRTCRIAFEDRLDDLREP
ncbi:MAG: hypothetical protein QM676_15535 [Novosphingobium sp.]